MTTQLLSRDIVRDFDSDFERDFDDLVWGRRAGHMGHHEYDDSSMPLWASFLADNQKIYYTPDNEIELIERAAAESAQLLGDRPVTIVSRGCGTKFLAKEGQLIRHFKNVVGVVYLDRAEAALRQSVQEGRSLLPDAWHMAIQDDIYDPKLRYPVDGIEVGTCFGLTLMNIEGFPDGPPPADPYIKNISAIREQMRHGSHFITTYDHNQDRKSVEMAYAGQTEFAKDMLRRHGSINPEHVDFVVKFHDESQILSHGFRFNRETVVTTRSGVMPMRPGQTLWFNNSVKPSIDNAATWNRQADFKYARNDIPLDSQGYLGWHHLMK